MKHSKSIMISISTKEDIQLLKQNKQIKYVNIDLTNCNLEVIEYLKEHGKDYYYSDMINNKNGYIYVDYETFLTAENIIDSIILGIDSDFTDLEKARYLYVKLGKLLSYDINIYPEKNEVCNYVNMNILNNVWGSLSNRKATNISFVKIYYYLCSILKLDNEIVALNHHNYLGNKLSIDDNILLVDLTQDVPFIQAGFQTRRFANFNDDIELDKKIGYIKKEYTEKLLDKVFKKINLNDSEILKNILLKTQDLINVANIKPTELGIIYDMIFNKYCPTYDIRINNLFVNDIYSNKEHFILISYGDEHYSYNFKKNSFVQVTNEQLVKNIKRNKIGLYLDEEIPNLVYPREKIV